MALYLPSLSADIIDASCQRRHRLHRPGRRRHARRRVRPDRVLDRGARLGARTAISFGRDVRGAIFHRVGTFSQREVRPLRPPSLITRQTDDVQQVQMSRAALLTLMVMAPIMMHGHLHGDPAGPRLCLDHRGHRAGARRRARLHHLPDGPELPVDAEPDRRGQPAPPRADHRRPCGPRVRACRWRPSASPSPTATWPRSRPGPVAGWPRCSRP